MSASDDSLPVAGRRLAAGRLSVELHGITLRYIRFGNLELIRRIYPAVRNEGWGTVPASVRQLAVIEEETTFTVTFSAVHREGDLLFEWRGRITGDVDGRIRYEMNGAAGASFAYNRIGLCVAHPPSQAGRSVTYRLGSVDHAATLPGLVEPQRWEDGRVYPAFGPYDRLEIDAADDVDIVVVLTGDQFELEDQRNWVDGSFKTYSTPLSLGWPHRAALGDEVGQSVDVTTRIGDEVRSERVTESVVRVGEPIGALPAIGLQLDATMPAPGEDTVAAVEALSPDHLRIELDPSLQSPETVVGWPGIGIARRLGVPLEVAVHVGEGDTAVREAVELLGAVSREIAVARAILLRSGIGVGDGELAEQFREAGLTMPMFGGTIGNFAEINRATAPADGLDGIAFPMTPTFHDRDGLSIVEGLEAVPAVIRTARARAAGSEIVVSPLTLRPKFNVLDPTWTDEHAIDARLDGQFVAGWLVGVLGHLGQHQVPSVTMFEAFGPRGVVGSDGVPRPIYSVLAQIAAATSPTVREVAVSTPLDVAALAFDSGSTRHVLVANLRSVCHTVDITGQIGDRCFVSRLSRRTHPGARLDEAPPEPVVTRTLRLAPFDVVLVTGEEP